MKIKLIIAILLFFAGSIFSQRHLSVLTYNMGVPEGNLADFVGTFSYRGLGIQSRVFVEKDVSIGGKLGWNIFDEKSDRLIVGNNWAVSGTNVRNLNVFPFLVNSHYYIGERKGIRLYIGANTGLYYITQKFQMGTARLFEDNWHFGIAPEAGIIIPVDKEVALTFSIDYNFAFDSGESVTGSEDNSYSFIGLNIGLAWDKR